MTRTIRKRQLKAIFGSPLYQRTRTGAEIAEQKGALRTDLAHPVSSPGLTSFGLALGKGAQFQQ